VLFLTSALLCGYAPQNWPGDGLPSHAESEFTYPVTVHGLPVRVDVSQDFDPTRQSEFKANDMMEESMLVPAGLPSVQECLAISGAGSGRSLVETQETDDEQSSDYLITSVYFSLLGEFVMLDLY